MSTHSLKRKSQNDSTPQRKIKRPSILSNNNTEQLLLINQTPFKAYISVDQIKNLLDSLNCLNKVKLSSQSAETTLVSPETSLYAFGAFGKGSYSRSRPLYVENWYKEIINNQSINQISTPNTSNDSTLNNFNENNLQEIELKSNSILNNISTDSTIKSSKKNVELITFNGLPFIIDSNQAENFFMNLDSSDSELDIEINNSEDDNSNDSNNNSINKDEQTINPQTNNDLILKQYKINELQKNETNTITNEIEMNIHQQLNLLPFASIESNNENLLLTIYEAFYLQFSLGVLTIQDLNLYHFFKYCQAADQNFIIKYAAYHYFRIKNWIPRSGMYYGCDFVLYRYGPGIDHGTYCVMCFDKEQKNEIMNWKDIQLQNRLTATVNKKLVYCQVEGIPRDEHGIIIQDDPFKIFPNLSIKNILVSRIIL